MHFNPFYTEVTLCRLFCMIENKIHSGNPHRLQPGLYKEQTKIKIKAEDKKSANMLHMIIMINQN